MEDLAHQASNDESRRVNKTNPSTSYRMEKLKKYIYIYTHKYYKNDTHFKYSLFIKGKPMTSKMYKTLPEVELALDLKLISINKEPLYRLKRLKK